MPKRSESQIYEQDEDGFRREIVRPWVRDKHARLAKYVQISRGVRGKWIGPGKAGATFIDLFSGPGRVRIRNEKMAIHGSPLVAWNAAISKESTFTEVHIADLDPKNTEAVEARLKKEGASVFPETGPAIKTIDRVLARLNPKGLHFAFLDPYNLGNLNFEVIRKLASLEHMDILMHVSISDLRRNLQRYKESEASPLDAFAPGWRAHVGEINNSFQVRGRILEYWRQLLKTEGMDTTDRAELVTGDGNQPLYLLAFVARHPLALEFWEKIRNIDREKQYDLL